MGKPFLFAQLLCVWVASAVRHPYSTLYGRPSNGFLERTPSASLFSPSSSSSQAFCVPSQPCWPTPSEWAAFNTSLGGALLGVVPPLASCFGFGPVPQDGPTCTASIDNYTNSYWRAAQPGATQEVNWEQDSTTGADCFDGAKPCELGNIPPFAVKVTSGAQVSTALAFAAAHTLRIVIKSSGHEYQGRSSGGNALLLWTHGLVGLQLHDAFTPCPGQVSPRPALSTSPGTSWGEAYAAADAARVTVVGGSEISVSSCGGYTMGGGHSWQGPAFGMAVDNLLSAEVVLANGSTVTASQCSNPDLFWALRGGGGGTFGVVLSCTYATHPFPQQGATGAFITVELLQGNASFAVLMEGWLGAVEGLGNPSTAASGVVAGGYFIPTFDAPEGTHEHMSFLLGFNGTTDQATAALGPIKAYVESFPQHLSIIGADLIPFPSLMAFHEYYDAHSEATGYAGTLGSRILPLSALANPTSRSQLAQALTEIAYDTGGLTGMLVAGGAVSAGDGAATALNPIWRSAGVHVAFGASWPLNSSLALQQNIFSGVSFLTEMLRVLTPGSGAYWSESDYLEPQWQDAFWGPNYARLQGIKHSVDPLGVFACQHCVEGA